jgi:hypothetical protein
MQNTQYRHLRKLRAMTQWPGGSVGQMELLADISGEAAREALWACFRHLFNAPTQDLVDAVMNHCAKLILARVKRGELSLLTNPRASN